MFSTVLKVTSESPSVKTITLKPEEKLDFKPGQWILASMQVKNKSTSKDEKVSRAYSISSTPNESNINITIKLIEDGKLSPELHKLKAKDKLEIKGPFGKMFYNKEKKLKQIILIAGGCGIAPVISIAKSIQNSKDKIKVNLFYSEKDFEDIEFKETFKQLEKDKRFNVLITLTRCQDKNWIKEKRNCGRFSKETFKNLKTDNKSEIFICGSPDMTKTVQDYLLELKIPKEIIQIESY